MSTEFGDMRTAYGKALIELGEQNKNMELVDVNLKWLLLLVTEFPAPVIRAIKVYLVVFCP